MSSPLQGIRILDLTRVLAGPYGTLILGDLGAEVIKVEPPEGDGTRGKGSTGLGATPDYYMHKGESAYFMSINRNKKSVVLDLKQNTAKKVFLDIASKSDIVIENFRPGVADRLGIGYEAVKSVKPDIIYCSISGYGADGPLRDWPAFDVVVQAMGGGMSITGEPGRPPCRAGIPIGDLAGGMFAAIAILAALHRRDKTGEGEWLDMSLLDGQISMLTYVAAYNMISGMIPRPVGSGHQTAVPYGAYPTKDYYIVITATNDRFFRNLCKAFREEQKAGEPGFRTAEERAANRAAVDEFVASHTREKTNDEWMQILKDFDVPISPVLSVDKALAEEQVKSRGMIVECEHSLGGVVKSPNTPFTRMRGIDPKSYTCPPLLGEHTEEILKHLLNYSEDDFNALIASGAIIGHTP